MKYSVPWVFYSVDILLVIAAVLKRITDRTGYEMNRNALQLKPWLRSSQT